MVISVISNQLNLKLINLDVWVAWEHKRLKCNAKKGYNRSKK